MTAFHPTGKTLFSALPGLPHELPLLVAGEERESREAASPEDETGKEAGSWWDAEEAGGGSKGTALCSADRHTATWPLCAQEGGERGLKSQLPTAPTIEGPLSTSPLTASVSHLQNGESE